jgi:hypothetical protein
LEWLEQSVNLGCWYRWSSVGNPELGLTHPSVDLDHRTSALNIVAEGVLYKVRHQALY